MLHPTGLPHHLSTLERTLVMGVLNVTPDSFSDGGLFDDTDAAIRHGLALAQNGADIVDVGGESTRPGAERIASQVERDRVIPVVTALAAAGVVVSIDTMRSEVADAALQAGAAMVNDISGGRADEGMNSFMASHEVPFIMMHWRGPSNVMASLTDYQDVAKDVAREIGAQVDTAQRAGVARARIVVDPGIGFAKTTQQNWPILQDLEALDSLELPVLWGVSRKKFLGELLADSAGEFRDLPGREAATTALTTYLALAGVWAVRVHDARASRDAIEVIERLGRNHV
ncbi:MAG: dihydropteroate synthase [Actinomycetes bacterium]